MHYAVPPISDDDRKKLLDSEYWKSLQEHPGYKMLVERLNADLSARWQDLLNVSADDLAGLQGFIAGLNYALGYANAQALDGQRVAEEHRASEDRAQAETLSSERFRETRVRRGLRMGAEL